MTKKFLSVALALITVLSCFSATTVFGQTSDEDYVIQPRMAIIDQVIPGFTKKGITLYVSGMMTTKKSADLYIQLQIQKKKDGEYSPYITYAKTGTGTSLSLAKDINVNILYTYRLKATFEADTETSVRFLYY